MTLGGARRPLSLRFKNEKSIRSYLLGTLPQVQGEELEQRLLTDDDLAEEMSVVEEELIEDYARNSLNARSACRFTWGAGYR